MDYTIYINILKDTLKKKIQLLDRLIEESKKQEENLSITEVDIDSFYESIGKKETLITQLNELDDGFEVVYERFGNFIKENRMDYQTEIFELQELIRMVMDKSTFLQGKEKSNKEKVEKYLLEKKVEVRTFKTSNQAVSNYYKSMSDAYQGEGFFLDKKK